MPHETATSSTVEPAPFNPSSELPESIPLAASSEPAASSVLPESSEPTEDAYYGSLALTYAAGPVVAFGVLSVAVLFDAPGMAALSPVVLLGAPSLTHAVHGNWVAALVAPLGMAGSMFVGALLGTLMEPPSSDCHEVCFSSGMLPGIAMGYLVWAIVDIVFNGAVQVERPPARAHAAPGMRLVAAPSASGFGAALEGRFL